MDVRPLLTIGLPTLFGLSEITDPKHAGKWGLLFATIGIASGLKGLDLADKGQIEEAVLYDVNSILYDALAILKAIQAEVI